MGLLNSFKTFFSFTSPAKRRRIEGDVEIEVESLPAPKRPALIPKGQDISTAAPGMALKTAQPVIGRSALAGAAGMVTSTPATDRPRTFSWKEFQPPSTKKRTARPSFLGLSMPTLAVKETAEVVPRPLHTLPVKQQPKEPQSTFQLSFKMQNIRQTSMAAGAAAEIQPASLRAPFMQPSVDTDRFPKFPVDTSFMNYARNDSKVLNVDVDVDGDGLESSPTRTTKDAYLTRKKWEQSTEQGIQKAKTSSKLDDSKFRQIQEELDWLEKKFPEVVNLRLQKDKGKEEEVEGKSIPLPILSQEDYDIYEQTIQKPSSAQLVSHKKSGIDLHGRDVARLAPREWLNDELINLYMSLLLERDASNRKDGKAPKCHFFTSYFCNSLYKDAKTYDYNKVRRWTMPIKLKAVGQASQSVLECDRIVIPVNQGNMHWVCAVIDLKKKQFLYYDSLSGEDHECLENLARYLTDEYKNKKNEDREDIMEWPRLFPKNIPQQRNGCDCGMFAILFADYAGQDAALDFSQDNIQDFRVKVTRDLLRSRVE